MTRRRAGGGWSDVIPLSGARVELVVGRMAGEGIDAAAAMGQLCTATCRPGPSSRRTPRPTKKSAGTIEGSALRVCPIGATALACGDIWKFTSSDRAKAFEAAWQCWVTGKVFTKSCSAVEGSRSGPLGRDRVRQTLRLDPDAGVPGASVPSHLLAQPADGELLGRDPAVRRHKKNPSGEGLLRPPGLAVLNPVEDPD